jgi:hypothetical protein
MQNINRGTLVIHAGYGEGIVNKVNITNYEIFFEKVGKVTVSKDSTELDILETEIEQGTVTSSVSVKQIEEVILHVLDKYIGLPEEVELGEKWTDGVMILKPGSAGLQTKEIPIETFFHKIVMVRDKLRVLEQNINSHPKLSDEEKVGMQQYISRVYGSLTTFNILFKNKEDYFTSKGE